MNLKRQNMLNWLVGSISNLLKKAFFETKYGEIVQKAFSYRTEGDYEAYVEFEQENVVQLYNDMKEFISEVKAYLEIE